MLEVEKVAMLVSESFGIGDRHEIYVFEDLLVVTKAYGASLGTPDLPMLSICAACIGPAPIKCRW